ncbi:hypothetical protein GCM10011609_84630 [Lentzea pudingi]|uniref:FxLD family lantipeptide n=1 Tax=Lentzea pudingi TaxID=1789439 RepID=A0ABQ2IV87_9PSEU|nr:hypothetical protein [Lentzea pudingi]GGN28467.1 hypothetical protein GCM10011609_84630 [Lentzea pudingi]
MAEQSAVIEAAGSVATESSADGDFAIDWDDDDMEVGLTCRMEEGCVTCEG